MEITYDEQPSLIISEGTGNHSRKSYRIRKFVPSTILIPKIMHILAKTGSIDRTSLAKKARIHYGDMMEQIEWLEKKDVITITVENGKIIIKLNDRWREFAEMQMKLYGL